MFAAFWHTRGAAPCEQVAFHGPADLVNHDSTQRTRAVARITNDGGLGTLEAVALVTCSACGAFLRRDDVEARALSTAARYCYIDVRDDRRGIERRRHIFEPLATADDRRTADRRAPTRPLFVNFEVADGKPVTVGQIAHRTGLDRKLIRGMLEAHEVDGAYRQTGKRAEWRVPFCAAKKLIARLLYGSHVAGLAYFLINIIDGRIS